MTGVATGPVQGLEERLAGLPVIPVLVLDTVGAVGPLAGALAAGGLPCVEVTLRTPSALQVLEAFAAVPGMLVGAGSVTTPEQVDRTVGAGAGFVVSPGFDDAVVSRCRERGVPVLPGVATATEVMRARAAGVDLVKLFPAGVLGGPAGVRALAAPFPGSRFVPTGGVGPDTLADYLRVPAVAAVGGSWMVAPDLVREARWDEVRRLTRQAVGTAREVRP